MTANRLGSRPQTPPETRTATRADGGACIECGAGMALKSARADFCSGACRKAFNNRRMKRGAELYDLFMACRFQRPLAKELKLWRTLNRMASHFSAEDAAEREGRKSWRDPRAIIARHPRLQADWLG